MKRKMNNDFGFEMLPLPNQQNRLLRKDMTVSLYEYYLVGEITEEENYLDLCDALRSCSPQDDFIIRISSGGGLLSTANMIINAIKDSPANVHGYIEHNAGSAASLIYLACNNWSMSEDAELFVHTSSGGTFGKESETYEASVFYRKKLHKMMRKSYAGFLTESEIDQVLKGTDFYFDAEDISERLDNMVEYQQTLLELQEQEFLDEINGFEVESDEDRDNDQPEIKVVKKKKILPS